MELETKLNNPDCQLTMIAGAIRQIDKLIDIRNFYRNLKTHLSTEEADEALKDLLGSADLMPDIDIDELTTELIMNLL